MEISSVQFSRSVVSDSLRPHGLHHTRPPCPSPTPKVYPNLYPWVGDAIEPTHPLLSPSPPALNLFQHQGLFKWISSSHQMAKVLEFHLQHQSFQWTPGLISFRMDWLDLLAVQGTLKSLLQHHSSKAPILWRSAFFIFQLSHPYMTTGKLHSLEAGKCSLIFEATTVVWSVNFNSYWFVRAFYKHNTCMKDLTISIYVVFSSVFWGSFLLLFVIV